MSGLREYMPAGVAVVIFVIGVAFGVLIGLGAS
jgi:hypothetical protein